MTSSTTWSSGAERSVASVRTRMAATVFTTPVVVLIAMHIAIGMVLEKKSTFGLGLFLAALAGATAVAMLAPLGWAAAAIAYTAGAEVVWRSLSLTIPWESSKYITLFLCVIITARLGKLKIPMTPIVYFLLLLPSCLVLLADPRWDFTVLRKFFAAGLSAPLALTMCVMTMSQLRLDTSDLRRVLLAYALPILTLSSVTAIATYTDPNIVFTGESNSATSGGFGPNQVSTVLGLGALATVVLAVWAENKLLGRLLAGILALFMAAQSAMTFSRGGLYAAGAALAVGLVLSLSSSEARMRLLSVGLIAIVAGYIVVPQLDAFTGGKLLARFSDTDPTNRGGLMSEDIELWEANPILGVGPAASARARTRFKASASHTEYTRLLAEHGVFGAVALLVIISGSLLRVLRVADQQQRALAMMFLAWAALTMMHAAMRTVSPAFMTGLAWAHLEGQKR